MNCMNIPTKFHTHCKKLNDFFLTTILAFFPPHNLAQQKPKIGWEIP
jgi:hypothetical protein